MKRINLIGYNEMDLSKFQHFLTKTDSKLDALIEALEEKRKVQKETKDAERMFLIGKYLALGDEFIRYTIKFDDPSLNFMYEVFTSSASKMMQIVNVSDLSRGDEKIVEEGENNHHDYLGLKMMDDKTVFWHDRAKFMEDKKSLETDLKLVNVFIDMLGDRDVFARELQENSISMCLTNFEQCATIAYNMQQILNEKVQDYYPSIYDDMSDRLKAVVALLEIHTKKLSLYHKELEDSLTNEFNKLLHL